METIRAIASDLRTRFAAENTPATVVEGHEPMERQFAPDPRVVIYETKDTFTGPSSPGPRGAPPARSLFVRNFGIEMLIYNRSNAAGAVPQDHRDAAGRLMRAVLRALYLWAQSSKVPLGVAGGEFVGPAATTTVETFGLYRLQVVVGEAVFDAAYEVAEGGTVTPAGASVLNGGVESGCN